jgi:uncharacterized protein
MPIVSEMKLIQRKSGDFRWHAFRYVAAWHRAGRLSPPGHCAMPLFVCGLVIATAFACNRAPDEPTHTRPDPLPPTTTVVSATTATAIAPRCLTPLATIAPEVPKAAGNRCPADPTGRLKLARRRVTFPDAGASVDAELARSDSETERGLMYRKNMGEDEGMLFFIEEKKIQTFWMHNTCIPLDMLFIDDDGVIVGAVESAPVLDDGQQAIDCPSRYVLEVNAGWVRRHNVKPGQRVVLPS